MESSFTYSSWDNFWSVWEDLIEDFPDARRMALQEIGKAALQEVLHQIRRTGINDSRGRVGRWQEIRMGSRGGYVAVSPTDETAVVTRTGSRSARDITRYLERGHGIRKPSGRSDRYRPRVRSGRTYVPGRLFYSWSRMHVQQLATEQAGAMLEQLADAIDQAAYGSR